MNPPARTRVLRLLTFVCFFQFCGIRNGYTFIVEVSPLDLRQSSLLVSRSALPGRSAFERIGSPAQGVLDAVVGFTFSAQSRFSALFDAPLPASAVQIPSVSQISSIFGRAFVAASTAARSVREVWLRRDPYAQRSERESRLRGDPWTDPLDGTPLSFDSIFSHLDRSSVSLALRAARSNEARRRIFRMLRYASDGDPASLVVSSVSDFHEPRFNPPGFFIARFNIRPEGVLS